MSNSINPYDGSYEASHLDLCCLQKPIIIACGSERVKKKKNQCLNTLYSLLSGAVYIDRSSVIICLVVSVAQLDVPSDWRPGGRGFNPGRGRQHPFGEIDHEIFSTAILSLPLIQEGQLSVSGERMCTILVNRLED